MIRRICLLITFFVFFIAISYAVNKVHVYGYVVDENKKGLELVNVVVENSKVATTTKENGFYDLLFECDDSVQLIYSMVGYGTEKRTIFKSERNKQINLMIRSTEHQLKEIDVIGRERQTSSVDFMDASKAKLLPSVSGGIESILMTFTGVTSSNELSTQYNVRGGSYDENMVYVNGVEVFRPMLIRSGEQEGLSFVNTDMVKKVAFSSGGFDASYGDKMSSVLDVTYKTPKSFEASAMMSFIGASAFVGSSKGNFTQMHGIRYKSNTFLLQTLDTKGDYKPQYFDYQTFMTWKLSNVCDINFLGNVSVNSYQFYPKDRQTSFGTLNQTESLYIFFEGGENDMFRTVSSAVTLNVKPTDKLKLSFITSIYNDDERQTYDIEGDYVVSDSAKGALTFVPVGSQLGQGSYMQHARDYLNTTVVDVTHNGEFNLEQHKLRWGLNYRKQLVFDQMNEWEMRDSLGYSLPHNQDQLRLFYNLKSNNTLNTDRFMAFIQDNYKWFGRTGCYIVNAGVRANYWNFNNELLLSPRLSFTYLPDWSKEFSFRGATGLYYQAPFYKEIRDTVTDALGNTTVKLNSNIKSPRSLHFVLGGDYYFKAQERPFKFTTEMYLKLADRMISYSVDNLQIRYSGLNDTYAYTTGVDFKLFGELVQGADSWINLSLMNSKQHLVNDLFVNNVYDYNGNLVSSSMASKGWYPSSNEQRYSFSMFFQDYLPHNPRCKANLKLVYADGLPFGPPRNLEYQNSFRTPPYQRVDLGISWALINGSETFRKMTMLNSIKNMWLSFEVFNLLDISNISSYYWVTDGGTGNQMAVPNYLTGRMLNLRLLVDFK
jgi:CarboxypepD_reg-like domain/TonB-dependent Receptor Plug Domain